MEELRVFPTLNDEHKINRLKLELPVYKAAATNLHDDLDEASWWKNHQHDLPNWAGAAAMASLLCPSSASVERVFSILNATFDETQRNSLEDILEITLMLRYNRT